ncbi:hypothetical protein [Niallia taxi]|uniref:hypothetical protein n=1 Tax=Niallia taxi TaxID=2499688 RepID=UPI0015F5C1A8|nr:hypothetical protein [Niallia taxi]
MENSTTYKCKYCAKDTGHEKGTVNFELLIPENIIPVEALKLKYAGFYKFGHHHFCDTRCYNLKVLDDAIQDFELSLLNPEQHFLKNTDIDKAKETLHNLKMFKDTLINS